MVQLSGSAADILAIVNQIAESYLAKNKLMFTYSLIVSVLTL